MSFLHPLKSRRAGFVALLLLLAFPLTLSAGCSLFTPPPEVANTPQQALADGEKREEDARVAEKNNDKSEATERWGKVATYYHAVAARYAGTETGLRATVEQAEALDKGTNNKQQAYQTLKNALRQYKPEAVPETYPVAQTAYDDLVRRMDEENAKTFYYKVMETLVRVLGNDQKVSPVLAIFVIAVLVTVLVWPFRVQQYRSMKEMQRWMPEIQKIQEQYKNDPQTAMQKQQEFYKEHGINQFAGCLPMLLQLPITYFMYMVIMHYQFHFSQSTFLWINPAAARTSADLPWPLTHMFGHHLGEQDLLMLIVYAVSMYFTTKLMPQTAPATPEQAEQQRMMTIMMPGMFFIMMLQWQPASAFVLYWFVSNILSLGQQWVIYRTLPKEPPVLVKNTTASDGVAAAKPANTGGPLKPNPKLVSPKNRRK